MFRANAADAVFLVSCFIYRFVLVVGALERIRHE